MMLTESPLVSVVIPSTGRPSLIRAIKSVRDQHFGGKFEVIVAFDTHRTDEVPAYTAIEGLADVVLHTGGRAGAPVARNLGTQAASGSWIAYLDDDDRWLPGKTADQLAVGTALAEAGTAPILSCRALITGSEKHPDTVVPDATYKTGTKVEDYLFAKRRATLGRSSLFTSTLMAPSALAKQVEWRPELKRHQDWDWILRATREGGGNLSQIGAALVEISMGSQGSISASGDWQTSLNWVQEVGSEWKPTTFVDFLVAQPLRYALQARSLAGVTEVFRAIVQSRRSPSASALVFGLSGVLPRRRAEAAARLLRRGRR